MVREALKHAARLERRPQIDPEDRTHRRDEVADWIEAHAADEWPNWSLTDIAGELDCSRQLVGDVVERYFRPAGEVGIDELEAIDPGQREEVRELLGEVTGREALIYALAYRQGYRDARDDGETPQ